MKTATQQTVFDLQQVRIYFEFCNKNNIDFKEFLSIAKDKESTNIDRFIKSTETVNLEQWNNGEFYTENGIYYNYEDYCETMEGDIMLIDDASFCEHYEEYTSEVFEVKIYKYTKWYSQKAIDNCDLHYYNGYYYDSEALQYHELVIMENGNIESENDVYYWESDGEYHYEPEDVEKYVSDYHSETISKKVTFSKNPQFYIGFEIEKEDEEIKESILIDEFKSELPNWRKEKDGSLDDESGYELISPTFELNPKEIFKIINNSETLTKHINAEKSNACGGHINISEEGLTGNELFAKIKGYTPLFHALYYKRIDKNYSKGKSNKDLIEDNEKYQSVKIHSNRVEYRIVSAVNNVDTLEWRAKLMLLILKNPTACPKIAYFNIQSKFKKHIKQMYQNNEKFETLNNRIIKYTLDFENVTIEKTN